MATLTRTQARVFLREPVVVVFGLVFPSALLLVIGTVFPGATEVYAALDDRSLVEIHAPATMVMALLTLGIAMLPQALGLDRERGILRRLSATPTQRRTRPGSAIGVLIGARVPTAQAGVGTGMLLYFPMLFFAGSYLPLEIMAAGLRTVSGWTRQAQQSRPSATPGPVTRRPSPASSC